MALSFFISKMEAGTQSMERIDLAIKAGIGFIVGIVSIITGLFGLFFTVLLGLMLLDFITGLIAGAVTTGLSSSVGRKGFARKLGIIFLISAIYFMDIIGLHTNGAIVDGIASAYCTVEFLSILENLGRMGVPIHPKVKQIIAVLQDKTEASDTQNK